MASKGKFSFIKKKDEQTPHSRPQSQLQPPFQSQLPIQSFSQSQTQEPNIIPQNTSEPAVKKGFSFIKKTLSQKEPLPIVQAIEEKLYPSIDSLFTNELLFNTTEQKEEVPQLKDHNSNNNNNNNNKNTLDWVFSKEQQIKPSDNDKIDLSNSINNNVDIPSPEVSASGSNKAKFSFIKKHKENKTNNGNVNQLDNGIHPKSVIDVNIKSISINNQYDDNYESRIFTNDKSEQGSVSSKKNPASEATNNKLTMSPKDSSEHSSHKGNMLEPINQPYVVSNISSNQKEEPKLIKDLKPDVQQKLTTKLTDESINQSLKDQKNDNIDSFNTFISKIHSIKLKLQSLQAELISQNKQHEKLISDEQFAIEANDFEKADQIETQITKLTNSKLSLETNIILNIKELLSTRKVELALISKSIKDTDTNSFSITKLKEICKEEMESFINNELGKHNSENIRLKKMKEKLHFLKENLDTEKSYITEEEEKISKVIKTQSSDIFGDLDNLNQLKEVLNEKINTLKRQLEELENERDQLNIEIESKESEIEAIKSNFTHDFSKIELKKRNYTEKLQDYEDQEKNYQNKTNNYNSLDIEYNNRMDKMKERVSLYQNQLQNLKNEKDKIYNELMYKEDLLKKECELFDSSNQIKSQIEKEQKSIKSHNENIQSLHSNNKLLYNEISQIEIRIPALEEEKKIFVKSKNFKEAGRVSNELKLSLEKKNSNIQSIEENKRNINNFESNLGKLNQQIALLTEESKKKDKEMNLIRYEYLNIYLNTLNLYKDTGLNCDDLNQEIIFTKNEMQQLKRYDYIAPITNSNEKNDEAINDNNQDNNGKQEEKENSIEVIVPENNNNTQEDYIEREIETKTDQLAITKEEIRNRIEDLNKELQQVINDEDYESADKIQTLIDNLTKELNE